MNEYVIPLLLTVSTSGTDGLDQIIPEMVQTALIDWLADGCEFEVSTEDEAYSLTWTIDRADEYGDGPKLALASMPAVTEWIDRMEARLAAFRAALPTSS